MIADKISLYNKEKNTRLSLKSVFFDMDGVLFDSMPYHAEAWVYAFETLDIPFTPYEVYMNEGRTGDRTIDGVFLEILGRVATEQEKKDLYAVKSQKFDELNTITPFEGMYEFLKKIKALSLQRVIVTGSGQKSLLSNLETYYPSIFSADKMITAENVKIGKPNPEPYLKALEKAKVQAHEAIVIENAPLGVESAVGAGIFTIAVNTGVLEDSVLEKAGANVVYSSMADLYEKWDDLYACVK